MAHRDYIAEEIGEDWVDGLISRREALRRLAMLGFTVPAAAALLAACQAAASPGPSGTLSAASSPPSSGGGAAASASAGATASAIAGSVAPTSAPAAASGSGQAPGSSGASASAGSSASPGTSAAGRPMSGDAITFPGKRGTLQGFFSPSSGGTGAMLVIHENRGLTDWVRTVATRLAADGYPSLAVDLLSEEGGTGALGDPAQAPSILGNASEERLVSDMQSALDELARRSPGAKLGVIGFCFGGGLVWDLLNAPEPRLAAAVPFYGPAPEAPSFAGNTAAVYGVYAELDNRVTSTKDKVEAALKAAGLTYALKVYPGVDHAFFNDTGARYNAAQAEAAYADTLAWLRKYLV